MKTKVEILLGILLIVTGLQAQDVVTVKATSYDVSDNLNLEAVASLFGESSNLEDFEQRLNDPESQISNLDLNQDGYVDYIRVTETLSDGIFLVTLQAVLGDNLFQDIATIDVEKDESGVARVQITGDAYLYGEGYIIEPVFSFVPDIFLGFFWNPYHRVWVSPYYWRHYPPRFRYWSPYPVPRYRQNVLAFRRANVKISFQYPSVRRSQVAVNLQKQVRRNDYGKKYPERSFESRNGNIRNREQLERNRSNSRATENVRSTGRTVQRNWTPASGENRTQRTTVTRKNVSSSDQKRTNQVTTGTRTRQSQPATNRQTNVQKREFSTSPTRSGSNTRTQSTTRTDQSVSSPRQERTNQGTSGSRTRQSQPTVKQQTNVSKSSTSSTPVRSTNRTLQTKSTSQTKSTEQTKQSQKKRTPQK